jgi:hypothetical protein
MVDLCVLPALIPVLLWHEDAVPWFMLLDDIDEFIIKIIWIFSIMTTKSGLNSRLIKASRSGSFTGFLVFHFACFYGSLQ